jgi:hypothetical protein
MPKEDVDYRPVNTRLFRGLVRGSCEIALTFISFFGSTISDLVVILVVTSVLLEEVSVSESVFVSWTPTPSSKPTFRRRKFTGTRKLWVSLASTKSASKRLTFYRGFFCSSGNMNIPDRVAFGGGTRGPRFDPYGPTPDTNRE